MECERREDMTITGKHTKFGIESYLLVPRNKLLRLVPEGLSLYTKFGFGTVVIGAWNHSNAYVDDKSYGPVLEAWVAILITHQGKKYAYVRNTYNNSPSYAEPVNNIFKFTKIQADIGWSERNGMQEVEVKKDGKLILRFSGRPTFIPKKVTFSMPRPCWLVQGNEQFIAEMTVSPQKSRLALTSIDIPVDGPLGELRNIIKSGIKYSVIYEDASIKIPEPRKI